VARDRRQAPPVAALGPRIRRLLADNQRLIAFPVLERALELVAYLPLLLTLGGVETFSDYARAEATDAGTTRVLEDGTAVGTASLVAFAAAVVGAALVSAYLRGGFLRSFDTTRTTTRPEAGLVARLFALYLGSLVVSLLVRAVVPVEAQLLLILAIAVPTLFADYAIAFDGAGVLDGLRRSARFYLTHLGRSLLATFALLLAFMATYGVFNGAMEGAESVFPPVLLALILAVGLLQYASDCVLIGIYADRETEPAALDSSG